MLLYLLTILVAIANIAYSFPYLDAQATYQYSDGEKTADLQLHLQEYNPDNDSYYFVIKLDGIVNDSEWLRSKDFWSLDRFSTYYETCAKEEVTVIAGTFLACRFETRKKTMWFYPLPFQLVLEKSIENGKVVTRQLVDYK